MYKLSRVPWTSRITGEPILDYLRYRPIDKAALPPPPLPFSGDYVAAKFYFSDHLGIRVQGLWIPTYINSSSSGYYCGFYGCWSSSNSHYLYQWEFSAGLVIKFGEN